ncbi:SGNH/GDSL hydrolase family protein [Methylobacter sp.]|uniref:SGNH/GDSL hydrolase family protein n=1 Tax=Methylobacter sp. TaxID=2051955 RepID=UPI001229BE23|nr:SGNH/GDSL hydrolase family protein [Methylobacter sp.]TAK64645.1 MAG: SGNH/GDSL hydrolase family protein [Methylobacter sp.]
MSEDFSYLDKFTPEELANFKEASRLKAVESQHAQPFVFEAASAKRRSRIIAEGDSWFDYLPGSDLIDCLRNLFDYDIEKFAKAGDTLENMIYGTDINRQFQREIPQIHTILRRIEQIKPKVFLFSGGGNDVAGDEFESYLNHKLSGLDSFRFEFASQMINNVFRRYFEDLITAVAQRSPDTHIVTHGYGHTIPTGKGVNFVFFTFAGPWLRPALAQKAILDEIEQQNIVFKIIDLYNDMLTSLDTHYPNFHYVDLRPILDPYADWANELHPINSAFARAAQRLHETMAPLFNNP